MGCIYKATNKVNGKGYVGKTKHTLEHRKATHEKDARLHRGRCLFYRAIRKYGFDMFEWDIVYDDVPEEDLNNLEIESIEWFGTVHPNGYNMSNGGEGGANRIITDEHRANISKANKGKNKPQSMKDYFSALYTGKPMHTEATKKQISEASKRMWQSDTHRDNIRQAMQNWHKTKPVIPRKVWTDEERKVHGDKSRARWQQPGYRERVAAAVSKTKKAQRVSRMKVVEDNNKT